MNLCLFAEIGAGAVSGDLTERMMLLVIQVGLILFAARIGHILFVKAKLSGVLGEVIAGILIGPYLLGAISIPGFELGLFPMGEGFPVSPELYGLCAIATIILLFHVGLETDIKLLKHYSIAGGLVGIGGVVFSFIFGDLITMAFSEIMFGERLGFLAPECMFLGVIATATSVGISARILSDKDKIHTPEGVTIVAGAVVDDVLGIIVLAVVLGVISASQTTGEVDWAHIGGIAGKAIGVWIAATAIGLAASRKIGFLLKMFRDRSAIALMALGLALILAGLFEQAGLAMIVGAYVMGLSLSQTDIKHVVRERLVPLYQLLVPFFFCVMGMLIDFRVLASPNILMFGLVYTAIAIIAKIGGSGLPTLLCGFNWRGAMRIGTGMIPRCEIALTIAAIGLARGVVSQEVVGVTVILMAVTTLITPPALVALFADNKPGTRKTLGSTSGKEVSFSFPSHEIIGLLIPRILADFEKDGFFAHLLSRHHRVHQLRKDQTIIGLRVQGRDIIFTCAVADIPLVNTAMYEVVAEFEQLMKRIREPIDGKAIARKLQDGAVGGQAKAGLAAHLSPRALEPNLHAETKEGVIDELLHDLEKQGLVTDFEAAKQAVWEREQSMSTGMQYGIAIPHGRTDAVADLVCAIGIKREGLEFDSLDGAPSNIIVLALSPQNASAPHMQFMSLISQVLDEKGREALLTSNTSDEMYRVLVGSEPEEQRGGVQGLVSTIAGFFKRGDSN